ncbi:MAG: Holliday junction resolvase RuvX [Planctomycetes bacterium]|nr:Holliday junction resolvase RuvX [Planctomycetota bacterium]
MGRILAVDHGERRAGIALSDPLGIAARPLREVVSDSPGEMVSRIAELARTHEATRVVVGHPRNMDGSRGARALAVERFAAALARALDPIPVELVDERLTTQEAAARLRDRRPGRRGRADAKEALNLMAARIILQDYLDARGGG